MVLPISPMGPEVPELSSEKFKQTEITTLDIYIVNDKVRSLAKLSL